jgi:hypothetical protein
MFAREVSAEYFGLSITVRNTWANGIVAAFISEGVAGARKALGDETLLLVNGEVINSTKTWIVSPKSTLLLQSHIETSEGKRTVTVYARSALLRNMLKVCVDGERIAGDNF